MEKISVVVPVYKAEKYINRCIDSILAQTYRDFELILVNDGSPDKSGEICEQYSRNDVRIIVLHQENQGPAGARNLALDYIKNYSNTDWITFVDSDDWIHPNYLEVLYKSAKCNNVNISVVSYITTNGEEISIDVANDIIKIVDVEDFWMKYRTLATIPCCKLYKAECFKHIRYPEEKIYEDEYTIYRILFEEHQIVFNPIPLYFYFINKEGITQAKWSMKSLDILDALKNQADYFKKNRFWRAYKSSARLYLEKLFFNLYNIDDKSKKSQLQKRIKMDLWKYGAVCNFIPEQPKYKVYKTVVNIKKQKIDPILERYMRRIRRKRSCK